MTDTILITGEVYVTDYGWMSSDFSPIVIDNQDFHTSMQDFIDIDTENMRTWYRGAPITYGYRWERA